MRFQSRRALGLALLALGTLAGCSSDEEDGGASSDVASDAASDADVGELPATIAVEAPSTPIVDMATVEDLSEAVANRFIDFSDKLRRRSFHEARAWVSPHFAGHSFAGLDVAEEKRLPLDSKHVEYDASTAPVVGRTGFLDSIAAWIGDWERIETVVWKVKGAEFQTGFPAWGKVHFRLTMLGSDGDGGPLSFVAWGDGRVEQENGAWMLAGFELESLASASRSSFLFTDVATSSGVAHAGIRFGSPGNASFAWNGAAGGDVDGDGLWDLFVPSSPNNFLYMGKEAAGSDGAPRVATFKDEAAARGVQSPAGGTGAVFFDYDNDGDQDLALAGVGWDRGGDRLRLWRNDGKGHFEEVGEQLGFSAKCHGFALVAFDAEGDGYLDLFVSNYGRVESEPNNSWIQATNGTPDRFFTNEGGKHFRDVSAERGFADENGWSYAAAAADYDRDGDMDLYVANDYGRNALWINDGKGSFTDLAEADEVADLGNGMGCAWGDIDNDGVLDLYVSNMSSTAGNRILKRLAQKNDTWNRLKKLAAGNSIFLARSGNEDAGVTFERSASSRGGTGGSWAWSPAIFDLNLDGRLDLYCCSGFVTGDTPADT